MLVAPCGREIFREIGGLLLVEIDDAQHGEFVAIGVGHDRMRREREAIRFQNQMLGHGARGLQIFFHQRGRHCERLAGVVEASLIRRVDRKFLRRSNIDTGQVANGVVVFCVAQPAGQYRTWITGVFPRLVFA